MTNLQASTFSVRVPRGTYVAAVKGPDGSSAQLSDRSQFSRTIDVVRLVNSNAATLISPQISNNTQCPLPYADTFLNTSFCQSWCIDGCPLSNPNLFNGYQTAIAQAKLAAQEAQIALGLLNSSYIAATTLLPAQAVFVVPSSLLNQQPVDVINKFIDLVETQLTHFTWAVWASCLMR